MQACGKALKNQTEIVGEERIELSTSAGPKPAKAHKKNLQKRDCKTSRIRGSIFLPAFSQKAVREP